MITFEDRDLVDLMEMVLRFTNADLYKSHLSARLQVVLQADNYTGLMSGLDGNDVRLAPTRYRQSLGGVSYIGKPTKVDMRQRHGRKMFSGFAFDVIPRDYTSYMEMKNIRYTGNVASVFSGNTRIGGTESYFFDPSPRPSSGIYYRHLVGPPTAPNWENSRVITNYATEDESVAGPRVSLYSMWKDIRNEHGEPFLMKLIAGEKNVPPRDITGLRYWGLFNAENQAGYFFDDLEQGTIA